MFGFGGSKSKSSSTGSSSSSSFSNSDSSSFDTSQSRSVSGGSSLSENQATNFSNQAIAFDDVFARLFGSAESGAASLDPSLLTGAANQLFSGGTQFLAGLGGDRGTQFLEGQLGSNGNVDAQLDLLQADIGELFREELLPGITSEAVGAGQLGGGRQGVAQGLAAEAAAEAFSQGAVGIRQANQDRLTGIAGTLASNDLAGAQVGLGSLGGLFDLVQNEFAAGLAPEQLLAQILGGPTVLTQAGGQSTGFSSAADFARAFSDSFGTSRSTSRAASESESQTESSSSSIGLKIGF